MANQSAKRIAQQNAARMATLSKVFVGVNVVYLVVRYVVQYRSVCWSDFVLYLGTAGLETFLYMNLYASSRPRYDPGGVLVSAGTDLGQPGLVSYMFDYIYISWLVHLLSLATRWAWALYLAIPVYLLVVAAPYIRQFWAANAGAEPQPAATAEDAAREKKRREKKERKQQRPKYVRG
ncbi:hypothetical protein LPJ63_002142 [Coemansia sp. RSA 2711]|nr:hypothetical protein LPJ63_002142 [Coemansia sp. RSA 2711]KAJ1846362.1 hypothetical protein LPJ70_002079 [Coemansia sp. RSA 2708]KAJ2313921.1 hypothetical protein IWW54_001232 [Coemansia sp. RSA 2705]KAJ2320954.1 hypothetical protein IWW52_001056 [Coemansia sp. RSA 2704]